MSLNKLEKYLCGGGKGGLSTGWKSSHFLHQLLISSLNRCQRPYFVEPNGDERAGGKRGNNCHTASPRSFPLQMAGEWWPASQPLATNRERRGRGGPASSTKGTCILSRACRKQASLKCKGSGCKKKQPQLAFHLSRLYR